MDTLDYLKEIASALRDIQDEMRKGRIAYEKLVDIQEKEIVRRREEQQGMKSDLENIFKNTIEKE